ncbi:fucolectin-like [Haliotis asinina]|uniref:fucolectin-like n=1 Tax=Haliotis asinina TaxID=109174 RepID=UPI0035325B48
METGMLFTGVLILKTVAQVYCGQNLALNKPAWMSSVYAAGSVSSAAENSVDGHLGTNWFHGVCSSTADNDRSPWIVIDLLSQYEVHNVTIYNRGDDVPERLHDFVIEIYRTNPSNCSAATPTICKAYVGVFGLTGNVQCESAVLGRFVRIWKPTTSQYQDLLTVCEIEVYGIRPDDMLKSVFIALPKKPNRLDCEEHRTISVMSHTLKLLLKIILERCRYKIRPEVASCQIEVRETPYTQ